jgi:diaminohydroxyphosphoribosylaminopyrimidine deaminase / 5-amino-6-(5-phosphoribosylamino)uracil reductase
MSDGDTKYMKKALALAAKGRGMTHPNPMVGAVLVNNGNVVGRGYHKGPGRPHAEVEAIREAGDRAKKADLYVSLEPCNHQGRTPPCSEAIIHAGISRVIIASRDRNPGVRGGGIKRLMQAGIAVEDGLLEEEARRLNEAYEKFILTGMPLVTVKAAITADGKIAARGGASRWITGEEARRFAHGMRRAADAVMVGSGTVAADDPELTVRNVRMNGAKAPMRVIVDSRLSIGLESKLAQAGDPKVMIVTTAACDRRKADLLEERGVEILVAAENGGRVDLEALMRELGRREVVSLLVEGGPTLTSSLMGQALVDRLALFIAPKVFGDEQAPSWMQGWILTEPSKALGFEWNDMRRLGEDVLLQARVSRW